jgi:peptide/nickel transport system permease protein
MPTSTRASATGERPSPALALGGRRLTRIRRDLSAPWLVGSVVLLLAMVVWPRAWLPDDHTTPRLALRHRPPAWMAGGEPRHPLGTDALGRSLLTRIVVAARLTLVIAVSATVLAVVAGAVAGLYAGYVGGAGDAVIMRWVDVMLAFPIILLILALVAALGASVINVILVLALTGWAEFTRVIRSATLGLREMEFVEGARAIGASASRIVWRHVLVNVASPILVLATFLVARFILTESAISFLGLGVSPPATTWGAMIGEGRKFLFEAWWATALPGAAIVLAVLVCNFVGDSMRDAFDPYRLPSPEETTR